MTRLISIISGKGGVGKTTTTINLGASLNYFGKDVIIADANLTTPNLGLHFGTPIVPVSLNQVLLGRAKITDAIYEHESGTRIIPGSLSVKDLNFIDHSKLKDVAKKMKKLADDFVIYDGASGLGEEALGCIEAADDLIIVTNPEVPAVTDALKTIKFIEERGKEVKGVIVTRVKGRNSEMSISNIRDILEVPILGVIPEDRNMQTALSKKDAIVHTNPNSGASIAYKKIAAKIANVRYSEPGMFARMFAR